MNSKEIPPMDQPTYPDGRSGFHSDSQSANTAEKALTTALQYVQDFRKANPDYPGAVRLTIDLKFKPEPAPDQQ